MHKQDYSLYFKIADDYLSYKVNFISYYENNLEQFCKKHNLESSQIISIHHLRNYLRFLKVSTNENSKVAYLFFHWNQIYDELQLSDLSRTEYYARNKNSLGVSRNNFDELMKAIEFKRAYDEYKSTQGIESASLTAPSEEDEELVKVVNIQENTIALENSTSINVASIAPRRLTTPSCNTSVLGTEIRVTANGHCISFNSATPERSVALVLKALSAS